MKRGKRKLGSRRLPFKSISQEGKGVGGGLDKGSLRLP